MARAALPGRLNWKLAEVVELIDETPRVRSMVLDVPDCPATAPASTSMYASPPRMDTKLRGATRSLLRRKTAA